MCNLRNSWGIKNSDLNFNRKISHSANIQKVLNFDDFFMKFFSLDIYSLKQKRFSKTLLSLKLS